MDRFQIGDRVIRNPLRWTPSEFDGWGRGEGVGVVVAPPFVLESGDVDVQWPAGRCFEREEELLPVDEPPGRKTSAERRSP